MSSNDTITQKEIDTFINEFGKIENTFFDGNKGEFDGNAGETIYFPRYKRYFLVNCNFYTDKHYEILEFLTEQKEFDEL